MESVPLWRNVYKSINGQSTSIGIDNIRNTLSAVDKDIITGLLMYKPYTLNSFISWKNDAHFKDKKELEVLMHRASKQLNLDCQMTYSLFCNYIMFEFFGKLEDIERMAKIETSCIILLDKLWQFYTTERMFLLKAQRFVIEKSQEPMWEHYIVFKEFTDKYPLSEFKTSFMGQFKLLTHELHSRIMFHCKNPKRWVDRNNAETIEVIVSFMYLCQAIQNTPEEIVSIMMLFVEHDFGRRPVEYYESVQMSEKEDLETILFMEYAVFLVLIESYWTDNSWLSHFKAFEGMMTVEVTKDHSLIMFFWSFLIISIPEHMLEPNYDEILPHYLEKYFTNDTFKLLLKMVELPFLKNSSLQIILKKALWPLLNFIASKIENPYFILDKTACLKLLASLMEVDELSVKCVDPEIPVNMFLVVAINIFPYDFESLTECAISMLKSKNMNKQIITFLSNIEVYAEIASYTSMDAVDMLGEQKVVNGFVIPASTRATVVHLPTSEVLLQFSGTFKYTYYHILEDHLSKALVECEGELNNGGNVSTDMKRSITGMKLIVQLLNAAPQLMEETWFRQCVNHGKMLFSKMILMEHPNYDLIEQTFGMCIELLPLLQTQIPQLLISSRCVPCVNVANLNTADLIKANVMNESSIANIISAQKNAGKFNILQLFIKLWKVSLENNFDIEKVHVPGLVYFLHEVFPQHLTWNFRTDYEKISVANNLLVYIFNVISAKYTTNVEKFIQSFCVESLFNYVPFIKTFLAYLRMPNEYIELLMCRESFWDTGRTLEYITTVRLCIRIVIWMFTVKTCDELKETKFWRYFVHSPNNLCNIAKTTCDYINHRIDPVLPKLACTLLRKICMDSNIPVLASLELDNYQVQNVFLERLRDPLVDVDLKVGILKLITVCVKKQNGMTAAFFNLSTLKQIRTGNQPVNATNSDTLLGYFEEYLLNIKEKPEFLMNPIQATLLELFHTLWTEKKTVLVKDVMQKSCFWPILVNPLINNFNFYINTYSQILDILGIEIFTEKIDENFQGILRDLFAEDSQFIKIFPERIRTLIDENKEDAIFLLKCWKKFLVFMVKYQNHLIPDKVKVMLAESTMEGMKLYLEYPKDSRPIFYYSQMYLFLITNWPLLNYKAKASFTSISECFVSLADHYAEMQMKCKETILTIAIKIVTHFEEFFKTSSYSVQQFLKAMIKIMEADYDKLLLIKDSKNIYAANYIPWLLNIKFTSMFFHLEHHHQWIYSTQMLFKTSNILGHLTSHERLMPFAKISLQFLINYVKSPLYKEVLYLDFPGLFDSMKFPRHLFDYTPVNLQGGIMQPYEEFWLTYISLMDLNLIMIERFNNIVFHIMLEFLDMHKQDLFKIIKLPTVTVNVCALKLVSNTIRLCNYMLKTRITLKSYEEPLLPKYYKVICETLNACVNILLRPKVMKVCSMDNTSMKLSAIENIPVNILVQIMERLTDIIGVSCLGLIDISPDLLVILATGECAAGDHWKFDYEFHIPSTSVEYKETSSLTFGGVLCLVHYLCKSLVQIIIDRKKRLSSREALTSISANEVEPNPKDYLILVYPDYLNNEYITDKFNSIQRFANSEIYSLAAPWLSKMNQKRMTYILEVVNTLMASQVFKAIRETSQNHVQLQLLKRDLCSEFQFYHEFVRKKLMDQHKYVVDGNMVLRNKSFSDRGRSEDLSSEYLLMLSHWFMIVCQMSP